MERASCSNSCPGLFSQLKEVYLFGCNTLNAEAGISASAEIARTMIRAGRSKADAERVSRALNAASQRKQPGRHAPHLRQRPGDLRLFVGRSGRRDRREHVEPLLSLRLQCRSRQRSSQRETARSVFHQRDDRHRGHARVGPARRISAGGLPVRRRSAFAGADAGIHSSDPRPRHDRSAHVSRPHRKLCRIVDRKRAPDPVVHRGASTSLPTISRRASASSPLPATPTSRRFGRA